MVKLLVGRAEQMALVAGRAAGSSVADGKVADADRKKAVGQDIPEVAKVKRSDC